MRYKLNSLLGAAVAGAATLMALASPAASATPAISTPSLGEGQVVNFVVGYDGKCMDIPNSSTDNHELAQQYTCNGQANQKWRIHYTAGSTTWFEVINFNSNKCLDVVAAGTTYLTNIQQYTCTGVANQLWNYDLTTRLLAVQHTGDCAGVYTGTANNKEPLVQAACVAGNAWDIRYTS